MSSSKSECQNDAAAEDVSQTPVQEVSLTPVEDVSQTPALPSSRITVGSRRSELALFQTREVLGRLGPGHQFSIIHMDTVGDQILDRALSQIGDKGLFTRELDAALLCGQVHFVVHSLKDLPTQCPEGLAVACVLRREMPDDALVLHPRHTAAGVRDLAELPPGAVLGTSSLRRAAQLARAHPHLRFESVRGNLGTRWRKLIADGSGFDGLILAEAGLVRIGWADRVASRLSAECLPAVGQGALAVQCRADDSAIARLLRPLLHRDTFLEVVAERSLLRALDGGCSVPLGVRASWPPAADDTPGGSVRVLRLEARVLSTDGAEVVEFAAEVRLDAEADVDAEPPAKRVRSSGDADAAGEPAAPQPERAVGLLYPDPEPRDRADLARCVRLGRTVADGLLAGGAGPILAAAKAAAKAAIGKLQPPSRAHAPRAAEKV